MTYNGFAFQILRDEHVPEGFDRSVSLSGLFDHGAKRFPIEWTAILAHPYAILAVMEWFVSPRPTDEAFARQMAFALRGIAARLSGEEN